MIQNMKNWANNVTNMSKKTHKTKENPSILWRLGDLLSFLFYSLVGHMYSFYVVISTSVYLETNVIEAISLLFVCFYLFFFSIIVLNSENTYSPKRKEAQSVPLNSLQNFNRAGSSFYCQISLNQKECYMRQRGMQVDERWVCGCVTLKNLGLQYT